MKIPAVERAVIPDEKLTGYLLNATHPVGGSKAKLFLAAGYRADSAGELRKQLLELAAEEVRETITTPHGVKYLVEGRLFSPSGMVIVVRTVWVIDSGADAPRFVTAYPI